MTSSSKKVKIITYYKVLSAYDKEDGDLTHKIKIDGNVDTTKSGTYEVKYKVTDSDGAQKISVRNIKVK